MEIRNYEYVIIPNILRDYKCSQSGECCQSKWRIDIDETAYNKTKTELEKLNESIETYFNKNEKNEYTAKFANGYCKFITEDRLCRIHRDFGWECLSDTCKVYPRILKLTSRGMEMGMVFSCRSSAKLLLTDKKIEIIKVPKDEFFFMKPSIVSFIIPENNLPSDPAYRYFELEEFLIEVMNKSGDIGKKFQYIDEVLKAYYDEKEIKKFDFKKSIAEYKNYNGAKIKSDKINDMIVKIILYKEEEGAKAVATEFINLLKCSKLNRVLEKDREFLREEGFSLTLDELENLKKAWTSREERVLNNYLICTMFNKDFYYTKDFATMKLLMLGTMLKFRILLYMRYLQRKLNDDELIYAIKSHDNDFSHGSKFFTTFYEKNKMEMDIEEYNRNLMSFLYK